MNVKNGEIGFGTWPLGGQAYGPLSIDDSIAALEEALKYGISVFDTADIYGDGLAEKLLGEVVSTEANAVFVSKAGYISEKSGEQDFSQQHIKRSVEASLHRLKRDSLDILLIHSPPSSELLEGRVFDIFEQIETEGLAKEVGVSLRSYTDLDIVLAWNKCKVIEVIFNLLDQRPLDTLLFEKAKQREVKVIARIPLCFGFLTQKYLPGTKFAAPDQRSRWIQDQIDKWIRGAESFNFLVNSNRSLAQAAISFCAKVEGCSIVIPGMKNTVQVQHNAVSTHVARMITDEEMTTIRETWNNLAHIPPR